MIVTFFHSFQICSERFEAHLYSNFSKVFEMVLYNRILISFQPFISPFQHILIRKRSTVTNLVTFTQFFFSEVLDKMARLTLSTLILLKHFIGFRMFCCTSRVIMHWIMERLDSWIDICPNVIIL